MSAVFLGLCLWMIGAQAGEGLVLAGIAVTALGLLFYFWRQVSPTAPQSPPGVEFIHLLGRYKRGLLIFSACVGWGLVSALWAEPPLRTGAPWFVLHISFFPLALVAVTVVPMTQLLLVSRLALILALLSAVAAVLQYWGVHPDWELLNHMKSYQRVLELAEDGHFKAGGLHFHRLKYAHTFVPLFFALAPALFVHANRRRRFLLVAYGVFLVAALALSVTRASWIALFIGSLVWLLAFYLNEQGRRRLCATLIIALALTPIVLALMSHIPDDRNRAWRTALHLWWSHPFCGIGAGGYSTAALRLAGGVPDAEYPLLHIDAHALILQILTEQGLIGLLVCGIALFYFGRALGNLKAETVAVAAAVMVLGVVHNWAFHPVVTATVALALALANKLNADPPPLHREAG